MSVSNLLKSTVGTSPFCNQQAGILSREHHGCRRTHQARLERDGQARRVRGGVPHLR